MIFGNSFTKLHQSLPLSVEQMLKQMPQKTSVSSLKVFSSPFPLIVQSLFLKQTISFLTQIVHLITVAVTQMADLSTLIVIVPLSNTEHVAINQKQTHEKDIIHMLNPDQIIKIIFMKVLFMNAEI